MQRLLLLTLVGFMFIQGSSAQCTEADQMGFVSSLPNGLSCGQAFQAANNTPTGQAGMQALDNICTTSCAGAVAQWLANPNTCNDPTSAAGLAFWCQPADGGSIPRCRWAVDLAPPTLFYNTDLNSCTAIALFPELCPPTCATGLKTLANTIGCCYQFIYNNTEALDVLMAKGFISTIQRIGLALLANPDMWQLCNVAIPSECTSSTFRDDATIAPTTMMATTAGSNIVGFSVVILMLSLFCALLK